MRFALRPGAAGGDSNSQTRDRAVWSFHQGSDDIDAGNGAQPFRSRVLTFTQLERRKRLDGVPASDVANPTAKPKRL